MIGHASTPEQVGGAGHGLCERRHFNALAHLRGNGHQAGFGLLEAIVAMTLLAGVGMAVFAWINGNLSTAAGLRERDAEASMKHEAVVLAQTIDPLRQPTGEVGFNENATLAWRSKPLMPLTQGAGFLPGEGTLFQLALYETEVLVRREGLRRPLRFSMRQLVYQRLAEDQPEGAGP